jgi:DNA-binding protein HU-beta
MLLLLMQELQSSCKVSFRVILGNVSGTLKKVVEFLVGFGSWSVSARAARDGRNPQTGKLFKSRLKML